MRNTRLAVETILLETGLGWRQFDAVLVDSRRVTWRRGAQQWMVLPSQPPATRLPQGLLGTSSCVGLASESI